MQKPSNKMLAIIGTTVVALGLMVLPALANTSGTNNWFTQMRTLMNQTFTPAQQQQFMSSKAMQDLHNSSTMQQAMKDGNIAEMQSLMNSDQALKAQIGSENIDKMNQMMGQLQGMGGYEK